MKICVLVDVYPHPFKPYFDVQFEEWRRAGHELQVFSLARIPQASSPVSVTTLKSLREAPLAVPLRILMRCVVATVRSVKVAIAAGSLHASLKLLALDSQLPLTAPDVFIIHNLTAGARFWYLKKIFPQIPTGLYYHGGEIPGVAALSAADCIRAFSAPDLIFSNTRTSVMEAEGRGAPMTKTRTLPVGLRLEDYPWSGTRTYKRAGRFQIVSVGRVALEKGLDIAVRALSELHRRSKVEFEYTIIGDGPEMANIRRLVQECGIGHLVRFTGALPIAGVAAAVRDADVLLLPSVPRNTWRENQACVMQEAMLMGVVVIASDIGGVSESIPLEMRDFLFSPGDHAQLAGNVERLLAGAETTLHALGNTGRDFVLHKYDVRELNRQILASLAETTLRVPDCAQTPYD
ncbi:MAG: glycosyl transferase group 1 [Gammaproteobacteria bacterium]|nr:glycosyl transferase group 1 [Gammaproteobacteria bacterium]